MSGDYLEKVNRFLISETDFLKVRDKLSDEDLREFIENAVECFCQGQAENITEEQRNFLIRNVLSAVVSLGPLRGFMDDEEVTEIMINGANQIYVQKKGQIELTDVTFENNRQLAHTIQKLLSGSETNKRVDESSPYVDFSLQDGSRVNVILPPCALVGPIMTIRKFKTDITTVENLMQRKMLNEGISTLLTAAMKAKLNVIFSGSTGAGKTTALNVFSKHIPEEERIITIEDTPELLLKQEHVVNLVSKPANIEGRGEITMRELFVNCLRMRPDRIIVGEVRGEEILDLIQSISSGHSGSLAIVHADTPEDCFNRMVTMMLMTGIRLATKEIQIQVAKAMDLIVHVELFMDGVRRVTNVSDLYYDEEKEKVFMRDIFRFQEKEFTADGKIIGDWVKNKKYPSFMRKFQKRFIALPDGFFDEK
ncbi:Type II/IV secretion system ATP hydrolase TadA/VirB11/CpaF, TadA subfamily [hydrothermal vent metagenome]|uniref:Type II/IV secretion system ATP hydrolase TadA/VirB11/CpaF, TadA subfamily n=1 Tax=hydrothermal vent metagenome TaxID=652676 RepID=A0A3B0T4I2_9ZZZZ